MPSTYLENLLLPIDPKSKNNARTWVRLFLKDKPDAEGNYPDRNLSDLEIEGFLEGASVTDGTTVYYRPHVAAANILVGEPERIRELRYDDFYKTLRRPEEVVKGWYDAGRAFDLLIPDELLPEDEASIPRSRIHAYDTGF